MDTKNSEMLGEKCDALSLYCITMTRSGWNSMRLNLPCERSLKGSIIELSSLGDEGVKSK